MPDQPLSFSEFDVIYQESVRIVFEHWTEAMQAELAAHCHAWGPGLYDFKNYLEVSSIRFYKAYRSFADEGISQSICDVGGFWGVFPLTLKKLGFDVSMTESLKYYGQSFSNLFDCIAEHGVTIFDYDPFEPDAVSPGQFDVVTVMAVLEHYPHSLKTFMENVRGMLGPGGKLYLEVPNIAYWPKRIELLRGRTPLAQLSDIFQSDTPFIGHHHEFTIAELRDLVRLSRMSIVSEDFYNYTLPASPGLKKRIRFPLMFLMFSLLKDSRECMAVLCQLDDRKEKR
jgi:2-polyprenyl-3-methyl-5-hydroxy-6-metoxy-1,4-benzoquinol methylase